MPGRFRSEMLAVVTNKLSMAKSNVDNPTRKIGIGISGFLFGLLISVVLLSLIGDWLIGWGLELIGAGLFAWFLVKKARVASVHHEQAELSGTPVDSSTVHSMADAPNRLARSRQ